MRAQGGAPRGLAGRAAVRVSRRHGVGRFRLRAQRGLRPRPPRQRDPVALSDPALGQPGRLRAPLREARPAALRSGDPRAGTTPLHCVCVHLALTAGAAAAGQIERLRQRIERSFRAHAPLIVAGDFNDWHWRHKATHELAHPLNMHEVFELVNGLPARSFPAMLPRLSPRPHLRARLPREPRARAPRPGLGPHLRSRRADRPDASSGYDRARRTATRDSRCCRERRASIFPRSKPRSTRRGEEIHLETYIFEDDDAGRRDRGGARARGAARRRDAPAGRRLRLQAPRRRARSRRCAAAGVKFLVYRPNISPWRSQRAAAAAACTASSRWSTRASRSSAAST